MLYTYDKEKGLKKTKSQPENSVQIDVISDLHLDFYLPRDSSSKDVENFIKDFRKDMQYKSDKVLIVSGDISHDNDLSEAMLRQLADLWEYVLVIPGNHDWYLQDKNKDDRYAELISNLEDKEDNILFLMDKVDIFEYKGVKIGGTIMFYNLKEMKDYVMWKSIMIDSDYLTREFIQARNDKDVAYYNKVIDNVDIFVSHVPIVNLDGKSTTENLFLNMDVDPKPGVLYLSGHTHYPRNSVDLKANFDAINVSYGYPSEVADLRKIATTIFIEKK